jgi:hypothetical protein
MPRLIAIERKRMVMVIEMQYFGVGSEGPLLQPQKEIINIECFCVGGKRGGVA